MNAKNWTRISGSMVSLSPMDYIFFPWFITLRHMMYFIICGELCYSHVIISWHSYALNFSIQLKNIGRVRRRDSSQGQGSAWRPMGGGQLSVMPTGMHTGTGTGSGTRLVQGLDWNLYGGNNNPWLNFLLHSWFFLCLPELITIPKASELPFDHTQCRHGGESNIWSIYKTMNFNPDYMMSSWRAEKWNHYFFIITTSITKWKINIL